MPSIYEMMDSVRTRLGDPRAQSPGDAQLLQQVCSQTRTILRSKRNSGNPWNYADTLIQTQPNVSTYSINVPDFGTPLSVTTKDDFNNPAFVVRRIPFYTSQDLFFSYGLPANAGVWTSWWNGYDPNHAALRCAITWRSNVPTIEFLPVGIQSATYVLRYLQSASGVGQMALTTEPVPSEDCDLIEVRSAQSLLGLTEWYAPDTKDGRAANAEKRKDLFITLNHDEQLAFEQFNAANLNGSGPATHQRWMGCLDG